MVAAEKNGTIEKKAQSYLNSIINLTTAEDEISIRHIMSRMMETIPSEYYGHTEIIEDLKTLERIIEAGHAKNPTYYGLIKFKAIDIRNRLASYEVSAA